MSRAADEFGGIDILVNNAGIQHVSAVRRCGQCTLARVKLALLCSRTMQADWHGLVTARRS